MISILEKCSISRSSSSLLALFGSLLIAFYLLIALVIGGSRSSTVVYPSGGDHRFQGVAPSGWTNEAPSFLEPRIYGGSAKIILTFAPVRPQSAGPAQTKISFNGTEQSATISREPVILTSTAQALSPIAVSMNVENPFPSSVTPGALVGVKISSLKITPRFGFLFPTASSIGLTVLFISLLAITTGYLFSAKRISLVPTIILLAITTSWYHDALYDHWYRGAWLWGTLLALSIAGLLYKRYSFTNSEECASSCDAKTPPLVLGALAIIFIFALWLRISAVDFGLPHLYHPDESRKSKIALSMVQSGNLDPNYFRHPSFLLYSTALLGKMKQVITGTELQIPDIVPLGRSVSATLGALSVIVIFLIGKLLYGYRAGLIAASVLSVAPLHVVCSRYIKEDVGMIFFALCSLYFALYYTLCDPRLRYWFLAALSSGLASSVKYTGVLSLCFAMIPLGIHLVVFASRVLRIDSLPLIQEVQTFPGYTVPFKKTFGYALILIGVAAIAFLAVTPYSILNSEKFIKDFTYEKQHMNRGHAGAISAFAHFWTYHLRFSIIPSLTKPVSILALFAIGFLIGRRKASDLLIIAAFLLFYLPAEFVNAKPFPQAERYILPCIPFMALALGGFLQISIPKLLPSFSESAKNNLFLILALIVAVCPGVYSTQHRAHALNDTRQQATNWVAAHIPAGSKIVSDWVFYSPHFPWGTYDVTELKTPMGSKLLHSLSLEELQRQNVDYLIVSSFFYHRYLIQVRRGNKIGIGFKDIFDKVKPIAQFSNKKFAYGFHNPQIKILKIPKD